MTIRLLLRAKVDDNGAQASEGLCLTLFKRLTGLIFIGALIVPTCLASATLDVPVYSQPITSFMIGKPEADLGKLEFVGGLLLSSSEPLFGAISSIRFKPDGKNIVAALDTGHWLTGEIQRDVEGKLSDLTNVLVFPMLNKDGKETNSKHRMDAEGLGLWGDKAYVSFEQFHRIETYDLNDLQNARPKVSLPILIPNKELRANGGLETLARAPDGSPLKGAFITVSEKSIDEEGNLYAAILEGPLKGQFSVVKTDGFDVTDGVFTPNGDLILLERRFNLAQGVGMRIRKIDGSSIKPNAVVDGDVILLADMRYQIDNMEGIDLIVAPDGTNRLILVSDDNHSFLQRNLMLEFKLLD